MRDLAAETAAWELLEHLRWDGPPDCPHCSASARAYFLLPSGGMRRTRTGAPTARRLWKCGACRRQFTVLTATVLEGTRIPLTTWLAAVQAYVEALADAQPGVDGSDDGVLPAGFAPAPLRRHLQQVLTAAATSRPAGSEQAC